MVMVLLLWLIVVMMTVMMILLVRRRFPLHRITALWPTTTTILFMRFLLHGIIARLLTLLFLLPTMAVDHSRGVLFPFGRWFSLPWMTLVMELLFVVFIIPSLGGGRTSARWSVDVIVVRRTCDCSRRSRLLFQAIKLVPVSTVATTGRKDSRSSSTWKVLHVVLFVVEVLSGTATTARTARAAHAVTVMPVATTASAATATTTTVMVMMVILVVVRIRFTRRFARRVFRGRFAGRRHIRRWSGGRFLCRLFID